MNSHVSNHLSVERMGRPVYEIDHRADGPQPHSLYFCQVDGPGLLVNGSEYHMGIQTDALRNVLGLTTHASRYGVLFCQSIVDAWYPHVIRLKDQVVGRLVNLRCRVL